jgi:hypothetical protein
MAVTSGVWLGIRGVFDMPRAAGEDHRLWLLLCQCCVQVLQCIVAAMSAGERLFLSAAT